MTPLVLLAALAAPQPSHVATLTCGAGRFRLESRSLAAGPLAPASQRLTVRVGGRGRALPLDGGGTALVEGARVRRAFVQSWACPRAKGGRRYVLLGYACAVDPGEPGACGDDKEWFRLLDDRGRALGAGLPHAGPGWTRLQRRLGLAAVMADGVAMTGTLPD
jgi:hypothetical protein